MSTDKTMVKVAKWILFGFTAPYTLVVSYLWVALAFCTYVAHNLRMEEYGLITAEFRPWFAKRYRCSTTLGRAIIFQEGIRRANANMELSTTERHERVHMRQVEDLMLTSFIVGLIVALVTGNLILGFLLWFSGGIWQAPNYLTAWMRGGDVYRDTEHERAAYAETDPREGGGAWLDQRGHD